MSARVSYADKARQGRTVAAPSTPASAPAAQSDPSRWIGAQVEITTSTGLKFVGSLFAYDAAAKLAVLHAPRPRSEGGGKQRVHILNTETIKAISFRGRPPASGPSAELPPVTETTVQSRFRRVERDMEARMERSRRGVPVAAEDLFYMLSKQIQCCWKGTSIFSDDLKLCIRPPFSADSVELLDGGSGQPYVQRLIQRFWEERRE